MIDKTALFAPRLPEETVTLPGVGDVRVRALTRAEVLRARRLGGDDYAVMERHLLAAGLIEPSISPADAEKWQDAAPASEIEPVTQAISRLSGLTEGAAKSAYADFRDDA